MRCSFLCALLLAAGTAAAQDAVRLQNGWELGLRYWLSTAQTQWSINSQGVDPTLGNPTSILTYERANAHVLELHARRNLPGQWFVRGSAGLGNVFTGKLTDEDFDLGQVKTLESESSVTGNRLRYAMLDVGGDLWSLDDGSRLGLFVGYHHWNERLDAYGAKFPGFSPAEIGATEPVISNEVTWNALRVGVSWNVRIDPRTRFSLDAAWLPYARLRNEDSHWLRQDPGDLGPAPNIFVNGRGHGFQLDLELRYRIAASWEAGAGFRHWWIESKRGDARIGPFGVQLVELESQRTGLTLSLTTRW